MENDYASWYIKRKIYFSNLFYMILKRSIDIVGATIVLILLLPIFLFICTFYFHGENKGDILFKQKRIGLNGKEFYIYKFRSMVINAEEMLKSDAVLYEKYLSNNYKLEPGEDPRITSFGCFIRRMSLDELPQFINVLKGEMSLVGPRPVLREELLEYKDRKNQFLSVKPGITGYWQINGRSNIGYPNRVDIELYYVENKCFKLDILILLKTFVRVFLKDGAY